MEKMNLQIKIIFMLFPDSRIYGILKNAGKSILF